MPHSQAFRLSTALGAAPGPEICIETRYHRGNNVEFIRWKDVEQVFSRAKYVLNGQVLVSFMVDDNFEDLEPKRIAHHPGVILEVVTTESEEGSAALPRASPYEATPPSSPLPGSISVLTDSMAANNKASDFVVFKETAGSDTRDESDGEDENQEPDRERVSLNDNSQDGKDPHQEVIDAQSCEIWSEDDELEAEFALRYYLQYPGTELGHSHFFQGDFVRYVIILANSKELKRLTLTTTVLAVATTIDATVVDPKVLKPIFNLVESKDIVMQEKASTVLRKLAAIFTGTLEWFVQSAPRIIRTLKELLEKNLEEYSNEVLVLFLTQLASEETFQREIDG
ncbi:hypothetical protein BGZ75_002252 [Mortierella antarctica]|nr:hypothetical protein BGZ75_002252 [Mortierella antarctica]